MSYTYRGQYVHIPRGAEVSRAFRSPNGFLSDVVQDVLDTVKPWDAGVDPIEPFDLPYKISSWVVALTTEQVPIWRINPHHKAREPQPSPYILLGSLDSRLKTDIATLELAGTIDAPMLTRVYPGDYMPPLPWMSSAKNAYGGRTACVDYWNDHAYVINEYNEPEDRPYEPPRWYHGPQ